MMNKIDIIKKLCQETGKNVSLCKKVLELSEGNYVMAKYVVENSGHCGIKDGQIVYG